MRLVTKNVDAGGELEALAKKRSAERGVTKAEAYEACMAERPDLAERALDGDIADPAGAVAIVKRAETLEDALDKMATERAARTGETFAKAYTDVLDTEFGRAAYAQICDLRERAARRSTGF